MREALPRLTRIAIDLPSREATVSQLDERAMEAPAIAPGPLGPRRYCWASAAPSHRPHPLLSQIARVDPWDGTVRARDFGHWAVGEPVIVPKGGATREDEA